MMKDVEQLILAKKYFELTPEEKEFVAPLAENEEDFEAIKWTLEQAKQSFRQQQIIPSTHLKQSVMAHLADTQNEKVAWYSSFMGFLFPEDKRIFQKPAFQFAMAGILVVGFLMVFNQNWEQDQLALHTPEKEEVQSKSAEKNQTSQKTLPLTDSTKKKTIEKEKMPPQPEVSNAANFDVEELEFKDMVVEPSIAEAEEDLSYAFSADDIVTKEEELTIVPNESKRMTEIQPVPLAKSNATAFNQSDDYTTTYTAPASTSLNIELDDKVVFSETKAEGNVVNVETLSNKKVDKLARKDYAEVSYANGASGEIYPKSMHVNSTRELNALFLTFN
jgi:hypothetical protein